MEKGKHHVDNHYQNQPKRSPDSTKVERKPMKVKYISSPIMVKAGNPSEFRAIVQQLTGKNADPISPDATYTTVREEACHVTDQNTTPYSTMAAATHEEVGNKPPNTIFNEGDFWIDCSDSLSEVTKQFFS
ncbi:hypothetical protein CMV_006646 [Castanea mollissima]|uniref:VQ domain-containing protein n=1 Tax=Castanea mollissima TaxID=60419 RepID=A0A8J4W3E9_9ROSI|nr:hypothetical protein CMV_006646 [Castanea mollissima]